MKITRYRYTGWVYDMTTEKQHSFYADDTLVHNCGKKRYMLNVLDNEGVRYSTPKLKIMGIEAIKSSTPKVCRDVMKKLIKVILVGSESEAQQMVADFNVKFRAMTLEEIGIPRGVSNVRKYHNPRTIYIKGTPMQSKAALIYNKLLKDRGLSTKYQPIGEGSKIKYLHLVQPNPFDQQKVIGFQDSVPPEIYDDIKQYIDWDLQFYKSFIAPIQAIMDKIDWNHEPVASLDAFF